MFIAFSLAIVSGLIRSLLELKQKPGLETILLSMLFGGIGFGLLSIWWVASPIEAIIIGYASSDVLSSIARLPTRVLRRKP